MPQEIQGGARKQEENKKRDERASNTEQRGTELEIPDKIGKMPEVDVTEDRRLFRLVNLRSCLKAIVPNDTALRFDCAVNLCGTWKLGRKN